MNAIGYICSTVWAIQPEWLQTMAQIAERENEPIEVLEQRLGQKLDNKRTMTVRDGVAIIPVTGPIFRYANLFTRMSGATSVQMAALDLGDALSNPNVHSILLNIDSPGGEANGINELANMISEAATQKPIKAYVGGMGASGGYWLASAADEIVIDAAAMLGSIGVVMGAIDDKGAYEQKGVKVYTYTSSNAPKKRPKLGTESGDAEMQARIDALESVFISAVAKNRGVSEETVINDFGQGGVMVGDAAVKAGLADRIGSFEALLSEMAGGKTKRKGAGASASSNQPTTGANGGIQAMSLKEKIMALFEGNEEDEGAGVSATSAVPTQPAAAPAGTQWAAGAVPFSVTATNQSPEVERLKAEVAALQASKREGKAEAFAESLLATQKIMTGEVDAITALYIQCAADDDESPLAEGSRVALIQTMFEKRAAHTISREFGKTKLTVVPSTAEPEDEVLKAEKEATEKYVASVQKKNAS